MLQNVRKWLAAPVFADPDQARRARLLSLILNTLIVVVFLISLGNLLAGGTLPLIYLLYLIVVVALLGLRQLVIRCQLHLASVLLVILLSVITTFILALRGTIIAPSASLYMLVIVISGLLFERRAIFLTAVFDSLALLSVMLMQKIGWLPPPGASDGLAAWVTYTTLFMVTGMLTYLALHQASETLQRARQDLVERQLIEQVLRESETRLRASEEKFYRAFYSSPVSMTVSSPTRGLLIVNQAFEQLTGYTSDEVLGRHIADLKLWVYPERRLDAERAMQQTGHLRDYEMSYYTRDGSRREAFLSAEFVEIENEVCYLVSMYDLTDRKQAEARTQDLNARLEERVRQRTAELQAAYNELEASNRELQSFSYSVSHDLRAPLRAIDGYSRLLLQDYAPKLDKDGRFYLENVRQAAQRMGVLIDDLLTLSRVTRTELIRGKVSLSEIASDVIAALRRQDPDRQVEVVVQPGLDAYGDSALLRVALENLLGNAWKFTRLQSAARIEFGVRLQDVHLVYYIRDNGVGFDSRYANKLFKPFSRLHRSEEFDGSGIGLASVHRIIHRHGGEIWAEGCPGEGATFSFTLSTVALD